VSDGLPMLSFDRVVQRFGTRDVLDGVSFSLARGERVALVGPSGAGKTTLFRLAYGAFAPTSGVVLVDGEEPGALSGKRLRALRSKIAVIFQSHGLVDQLSAGANVIAGTFGRRTTWDSVRAIVAPRLDEREEARAALAHVGLADRTRDRVFELSGGQRQRVAVARAIVQRASLVLADEPAASLDPDLGREVVELLLRDARERNATLLCTLHQIELTAGFDRVIAVRDGRIVERRDLVEAAVR
jgi:phosphonate transport system ATP-binding protein